MKIHTAMLQAVETLLSALGEKVDSLSDQVSLAREYKDVEDYKASSSASSMVLAVSSKKAKKS